MHDAARVGVFQAGEDTFTMRMAVGTSIGFCILSARVPPAM